MSSPTRPTVLGRALVPALRRWARSDALGAIWLALLVVINAATVAGAVDPGGSGRTLYGYGFPVLLVAVVLSWIRTARAR